jgi:hypothetical protein
MSAPKAVTTPEHRDREGKGGGAALGDLLQILLDRAREVNRLGDDNATLEAFLKQMQKAGTYIFESFPNTDSLHRTLLATLSQCWRRHVFGHQVSMKPPQPDCLHVYSIGASSFTSAGQSG